LVTKFITIIIIIGLIFISPYRQQKHIYNTDSLKTDRKTLTESSLRQKYTD